MSLVFCKSETLLSLKIISQKNCVITINTFWSNELMIIKYFFPKIILKAATDSESRSDTYDAPCIPKKYQRKSKL